jgi:hypothetical protein
VLKTCLFKVKMTGMNRVHPVTTGNPKCLVLKGLRRK